MNSDDFQTIIKENKYEQLFNPKSELFMPVLRRKQIHH